MSSWKQCHIAGIHETVASTASSAEERESDIGPYCVGSVLLSRRNHATESPSGVVTSAEFTLWNVGHMESAQEWEVCGVLSCTPLPRERSAFNTAHIPILVKVRAGCGVQSRWKWSVGSGSSRGLGICDAVIKAFARFSDLAKFGRQRFDKIFRATQHIVKCHVVEMHP